jgi:hypothetical protein
MATVRLDLREADGRLPMVCMRCGEPATVTRSKNMSWCPPWVGVLILAGLLPYLIVAIVLTKRTHVQGPFCDRHKGHWLSRVLIVASTAVLVAMVGIGAIVLVSAAPRQRGDESLTGLVCLGGFVLFLAWLIAMMIVQNTAIRPKEITDYDIVLTGVCDAFVDAVEEADREREAARRQRRRRHDDDEDDYVPPTVRPVDAIQEDEPPPRPRPPRDAIEE